MRASLSTASSSLTMSAFTVATSLLALSVAPLARAANVTSLAGTWASGSGLTTTGLDFFNPVTHTFTLPKAAGIAYSFTNDGFFEESRYRFNSNPQVNHCFNATLIWQHGKYQMHTNGSLTLTPFPPDGYVQIIAPCAGQTVQQYPYDEFEMLPAFDITVDANPGFRTDGSSAYAMQLYYNDGTSHGAPLPIMWQQYNPPNMNPTQQLFQQVLNG